MPAPGREGHDFGGFKAALEKLAPEYERRTGDKIVIIPGPSMGIRRRRSQTGSRAARKPTW
jgi:ABC-type molybdate transport system substrate-binding protein